MPIPSGFTLSAKIWRHAFSCANMQSKLGLAKEQDPSLTVWGMLTAIYQSYLHSHNFKESHDEANVFVHVSQLVRTWLTASFLYIPNLHGGQNLSLIVSPCLKETSGGVDDTPSSRDEQIRKFAMCIKSLSTILGILQQQPSSPVIEILKGGISSLRNKQISVYYYMFAASTPVVISIDDNFMVSTTLRMGAMPSPNPMNRGHISAVITDLMGLNVATDEHKVCSADAAHMEPKNIASNMDRTAYEDSTKIFGENGNIGYLFKAILYALQNNDYRYFPKIYIDQLVKTFSAGRNKIINVICHWGVLNEFVTGSRLYETSIAAGECKEFFKKISSGNMWGIYLKRILTQADAATGKTNLVYPPEIIFYAGIQSPKNNLNIQCEYNCVNGIPYDDSAARKAACDRSLPRGGKRVKSKKPKMSRKTKTRRDRRVGTHTKRHR